jgi:hypothetical protein
LRDIYMKFAIESFHVENVLFMTECQELLQAANAVDVASAEGLLAHYRQHYDKVCLHTSRIQRVFGAIELTAVFLVVMVVFHSSCNGTRAWRSTSRPRSAKPCCARWTS